MKTCSYCGTEYPDEAVVCASDQTPLDRASEPPPSPRPIKKIEYDFVPLSEADYQNDLVTLMHCRTLLEADMVAAQLRGSDIEAFLPDAFLLEAGYVRVQVSPEDYVSARNLLTEPHHAA